MKKKLLIILVLIAVLCSGCSKIPESNTLEKGQEKLESHEYDSALTLLSQVLDEDSDNESARAMYMQARKMQSAEKYEKNHDYNKAIKELNFIVNINDGSKKIKRESINKKSELEKLQEIAEKKALERKVNAKESSKKDINRMESEIIRENKKKEEQKQKEKEEKDKEKDKEESIEEPVEDIEDDKETTTDIQLNNENIQ